MGAAQELDTACAERARTVADLATARGMGPTAPRPSTEALAWRLGWDAPAAGEYPGPMLRDAFDLERERPDLAARVWHHVAGAAILGTYCCGTPAAHRDALGDLARELRSGQPAPV